MARINVHVVGILLRSFSGAPDSVFVVTTAAAGSVVTTISTSGSCKGHPGDVALCMLSRAARGLPLFLFGQACGPGYKRLSAA